MKRLTYPERHFQILSTPDIHPWIIAAYFFKIGFVYWEQAPRHGGGSKRGKEQNKEQNTKTLRAAVISISV